MVRGCGRKKKKNTRGRERGRGVYPEEIREERDKCYR
jgi:hypothetical protein